MIEIGYHHSGTAIPTVAKTRNFTKNINNKTLNG